MRCNFEFWRVVDWQMAGAAGCVKENQMQLQDQMWLQRCSSRIKAAERSANDDETSLGAHCTSAWIRQPATRNCDAVDAVQLGFFVEVFQRAVALDYKSAYDDHQTSHGAHLTSLRFASSCKSSVDYSSFTVKVCCIEILRPTTCCWTAVVRTWTLQLACSPYDSLCMHSIPF